MVQRVADQPESRPPTFALPVAGSDEGSIPLKMSDCRKPEAARRNVGFVLPFVSFVCHMMYCIYNLPTCQIFGDCNKGQDSLALAEPSG
jgi:hypothetical protein